MRLAPRQTAREAPRKTRETMVSLTVRFQHRKIKGKYDEFSITVPKEILNAAPAFKKVKNVSIDIDLVGNIVIKPKEGK